MLSKRAIVTGASSGIGFATAMGLAEQGLTVFIICRDPKRGSDALNALQKVSRGEAPQLLIADLSSQSAIREVALEIRDRVREIDVLINNAGAVFSKREVSVDGIERTLATNHLAPFLLTNLLMDRIQQADGRIVNVASSMHFPDRGFPEDLECTQRYSFMRAYRFSKLGNILFTYELARRLAGTGVCVNCVEPGPTRTRFGDNMSGFAGLFPLLIKRIPVLFRSPEQSARPIVHLASSADVAGVTGKYFVKMTPSKSHSLTYDPEVAARLWDISEQLTGVPFRPTIRATHE